jgi:hypothetical protein
MGAQIARPFFSSAYASLSAKKTDKAITAKTTKIRETMAALLLALAR